MYIILTNLNSQRSEISFVWNIHTNKLHEFIKDNSRVQRLTKFNSQKQKYLFFSLSTPSTIHTFLWLKLLLDFVANIDVWFGKLGFNGQLGHRYLFVETD